MSTPPIHKKTGRRLLVELCTGEYRLNVNVCSVSCTRFLHRPRGVTEPCELDLVAVERALAQQPQWRVVMDDKKRKLVIHDVAEPDSGHQYLYSSPAFLYSREFDSEQRECECAHALSTIMERASGGGIVVGERQLVNVVCRAFVNFGVRTLMMGCAMDQHRFLMPCDHASMVSPAVCLPFVMTESETGHRSDAYAVCLPDGHIVMARFRSEAPIECGCMNR